MTQLSLQTSKRASQKSKNMICRIFENTSPCFVHQLYIPTTLCNEIFHYLITTISDIYYYKKNSKGILKNPWKICTIKKIDNFCNNSHIGKYDHTVAVAFEFLWKFFNARLLCTSICLCLLIHINILKISNFKHPELLSSDPLTIYI